MLVIQEFGRTTQTFFQRKEANAIVLNLLLYHVYEFMCRLELKIDCDSWQFLFEKVQKLGSLCHRNLAWGLTVFAFKARPQVSHG